MGPSHSNLPLRHIHGDPIESERWNSDYRGASAFLSDGKIDDRQRSLADDGIRNRFLQIDMIPASDRQLPLTNLKPKPTLHILRYRLQMNSPKAELAVRLHRIQRHASFPCERFPFSNFGGEGIGVFAPAHGGKIAERDLNRHNTQFERRRFGFISKLDDSTLDGEGPDLQRDGRLHAVRPLAPSRRNRFVLRRRQESEHIHLAVGRDLQRDKGQHQADFLEGIRPEKQRLGMEIHIEPLNPEERRLVRLADFQPVNGQRQGKRVECRVLHRHRVVYLFRNGRNCILCDDVWNGKKSDEAIQEERTCKAGKNP